MGTGILRNGVDLLGVFGAKGASTAAATKILSNGTDLNQLLLARADGVDIGYNTGIYANGNDLRNIFGLPAGNTPLPINGNTYNAVASIPTGSTGSAAVGFRITTGNTWAVFTSVPGDTNHIRDSGAVPSGAVNIQVTFGTYTIPSGDADGLGTVTNPAASQVAVSSNPSCFYTTNTFGSAAGSHGRSYPVRIDFFNSSGVNISTTNITCVAEVDGSS